MVSEMSRRGVLLASATTATGALGGCLWNNTEVSSGHLYVENRSTDPHQIKLVVTEGEDTEGEEVVASWYRVPRGYALQFEEVIQPETAYTIMVHRPTVPSQDRVTLGVPTCGTESGARDVRISVQQDGMGISPQGCDEDYTLQDLEYVDPSEYSIDSPQEAETVTESE